MKKTSLKYWFNWLVFPVWILILIVLSCFVSVVKDSYKNKFMMIKKMWIAFYKNGLQIAEGGALYH